MNYYPYLTDIDFLNSLTQQRLQLLQIRVNILRWDERPIGRIEGKITGGNINIVNNSTIRRTANLSFVRTKLPKEKATEEIVINQKVFIEIGYKNQTKKYIDFPIIWFPVGLFIVTDLSIQKSLNGIGYSLQLKDKGCLLNGEIGGKLPASVQFDIDDNKNKVPLFNLVQELLHHFGNEPLHKILINDLPLQGNQVMKWIGKDTQIIKKQKTSTYGYTLEKYTGQTGTEYKEIIELQSNLGNWQVDMIYTDKLISNIGETISSVLDKIKSYLGNFEYYYDLYGNIVFQEIKNYLNTTQAKFDIEHFSGQQYLTQRRKGAFTYQVKDDVLQSISNSLDLKNIKNDIVIWGTQKTTNNVKRIIRYHLAIDKKPELSKQPYKVVLYLPEYEEHLFAVSPVLLPDSENEYREHSFYYKVISQDKYEFYEAIKKDDEQWDLQILKDLDGQPVTSYTNILPVDYREELYLQGVVDEPKGIVPNEYFAELKNEFPRIFDLVEGKFFDHPERYGYFLDFISSGDYYNLYNKNTIGTRSFVENDQKVNSLFPAMLDYYLVREGDAERINQYEKLGEKYIILTADQFDNNISTASEYVYSAFDRVRDILSQNTFSAQGVNLQMLPIFYLDANQRVQIVSLDTEINGDFITSNISYSFQNGAVIMNVSGTKAITRI